eukprot:1178131-Alexandrium_andersonii.AAC.1
MVMMWWVVFPVSRKWLKEPVDSDAVVGELEDSAVEALPFGFVRRLRASNCSHSRSVIGATCPSGQTASIGVVPVESVGFWSFMAGSLKAVV